MGPKMACEANPNPEDSPTRETWVCGSCSTGGDWLALRKARFLCAFAVRRFSAARASVVTLLRQVGCGPGQATPKYWGWCPALWGALWGSLETFLLPPPPPPLPPPPSSPTPTDKDTHQPRWVMYKFLYEVNAFDVRMICFSCLFVFYQSPSITMRKLEETSNQK